MNFPSPPAPQVEDRTPEAVVWLLGHYPDTAETDERIQRAVQLHRQWGFRIWLSGGQCARYREPIERAIRAKLITQGIASEAILCVGEWVGNTSAMDTVQEVRQVIQAARDQGVQTLLCVSNRLHLLQVKALLRRESVTCISVCTRLRDGRWWYVSARLVLIPLAWLGVGREFLPLVLIRCLRAKVTWWSW